MPIRLKSLVVMVIAIVAPLALGAVEESTAADPSLAASLLADWQSAADSYARSEVAQRIVESAEMLALEQSQPKSSQTARDDLSKAVDELHDSPWAEMAAITLNGFESRAAQADWIQDILAGLADRESAVRVDTFDRCRKQQDVELALLRQIVLAQPTVDRILRPPTNTAQVDQPFELAWKYQPQEPGVWFHDRPYCDRCADSQCIPKPKVSRLRSYHAPVQWGKEVDFHFRSKGGGRKRTVRHRHIMNSHRLMRPGDPDLEGRVLIQKSYPARLQVTWPACRAVSEALGDYSGLENYSLQRNAWPEQKTFEFDLLCAHTGEAQSGLQLAARLADGQFHARHALSGSHHKDDTFNTFVIVSLSAVDGRTHTVPWSADGLGIWVLIQDAQGHIIHTVKQHSQWFVDLQAPEDQKLLCQVGGSGSPNSLHAKLRLPPLEAGSYQILAGYGTIDFVWDPAGFSDIGFETPSNPWAGRLTSKAISLTIE